MIDAIPIAPPADGIRSDVHAAVHRLLHIATERQSGERQFLAHLRSAFAVEKMGQRLQDPSSLDEDALVAEVQRARGKRKPLTVAETKALKDEHVRRVRPLQVLAAEARQLERGVADLVNAAYGLTPDEVALMWRTAPPRMPGDPPAA